MVLWSVEMVPQCCTVLHSVAQCCTVVAGDTCKLVKFHKFFYKQN
jgi:hypothetical protein